MMNSGSTTFGSRFTIGFAVLCLMLLYSASIAADSPKVEWDSLKPEVQSILKPMQSSWENMAYGRQKHMIKGALRYVSLSDKQKLKMRERFLRWKEMPIERRAKVRKMFKEFRGLPKDQQDAIRTQFKKFKSLSPTKRKLLRDKWKNLSPKQKRRIIKQIRNRRYQSGARPRLRR